MILRKGLCLVNCGNHIVPPETCVLPFESDEVYFGAVPRKAVWKVHCDCCYRLKFGVPASGETLKSKKDVQWVGSCTTAPCVIPPPYFVLYSMWPWMSSTNSHSCVAGISLTFVKSISSLFRKLHITTRRIEKENRFVLVVSMSVAFKRKTSPFLTLLALKGYCHPPRQL